MESTKESQPEQSRLLITWFTIPDFKETLMSMLTPAQLTVFLTGIGYIMTDAERTRFMRLDRQIFKDTTALEKLMKEGYSVVLVSTRLHKLRDLIRYRGGPYLPLSGMKARRGGRPSRSVKEPNYRKLYFYDSGDDDPDSTDSDREDPDSSDSDYEGPEKNPDHANIANVWLVITHRDHLTKDLEGRTVIRHPDFQNVEDSRNKLWPYDIRYPRGFSYRGISEECARIFDLWNRVGSGHLERQVCCYEPEYEGNLHFLQDWRGNMRNIIFYMKLNEASPRIHKIANCYMSEASRVADPDDNFYATVEYEPSDGGPSMFSKIPL
ncbi:MAG: hypothetical protein Q9187_004035 [Circinaria calcarea]